MFKNSFAIRLQIIKKKMISQNMIIRMMKIQKIYLFSKIVKVRMKIELLLFKKKPSDIYLDAFYIYNF